MATWLSWSGMKAKISKCASLGLQVSIWKKMDPVLSLGKQHIPYTPDGVKFLGLHVDVPADQATSRNTLVTRLDEMLRKVNACPLTRKQKLLVYRVGLLSIEEFPISWAEKHLDPLASQFLKKWSGLARSANTILLHLSGKDGGLNLPQLSSMHKRLQVSRQSHLLTSRDTCVRHMAEKEVREVMCLDPGLSGNIWQRSLSNS